MKYTLAFLVLVVLPIFAIPQAHASCTVNSDWPQAPCLDTISNGRYMQNDVDRWTEYYSYKGSAFMEQKYAEMRDAINENRLQEWADKSLQNRNVYEYYFFSGRAPNTGEYRGQFDVIDINEEDASKYGKLVYPNIVPSHYSYMVPIITVSIIIGIIVFVAWKKRD